MIGPAIPLCKYGHPLVPENIGYQKLTSKYHHGYYQYCRICKAIRYQRKHPNPTKIRKNARVRRWISSTAS